MTKRFVRVEPTPGVRVPLPQSKDALRGPKNVDLNAHMFYWARRLRSGEVRIVVDVSDLVEETE